MVQPQTITLVQTEQTVRSSPMQQLGMALLPTRPSLASRDKTELPEQQEHRKIGTFP
jgi:hypothetical protein